MKIGIFAKTFSRPTIEELFQSIASYGIYSVQFNLSCELDHSNREGKACLRTRSSVSV